MQTNTTDKIAIIGAGPSGLAVARALQKKGIAFQGFEMGVDVGGLWNINNPHNQDPLIFENIRGFVFGCVQNLPFESFLPFKFGDIRLR